MRIEPATVTAFTIFDAPSESVNDPVFVTMHDLGGGRGQLVVACYGEAWSAYWGAMGSQTLAQFVSDVSAGYIANRMWPSNQRRTKANFDYLTRIVAVVQAAIKDHVKT